MTMSLGPPGLHGPELTRRASALLLGASTFASIFPSIFPSILAWILAALIGPSSALASTGPASERSGANQARVEADERVLIRILPRDDQLVARLRAELGLLGLEPRSLEVDEDRPPLGPDLLDQLELGHASAAIEIVISEHRVDLWVADGNTGKTLNRRLDLALDPAQADPRTVAIAAVELLRASRLELADPTDEGDESIPGWDQPPAMQAREGERPPQPSLPSLGAISLAPMVGGSPGGFGVTTHIELAGRWAPHDRFALRFSSWLPTLGNSITTTNGSVRMLTGMLFVEPQLRLPGGAKWFHPELGVGLGFALIGFEGTAREGLRDTRQLVGGFAGHTHLGLGFAVIPRLWIRLDGYVGVLLPQPQVKSPSDVTEATWGAPFGVGALGLEIWL
ncbi:MAG: hypothetical protein R6X02_15095 [Enhygromyxa sp.]